jgi:hypothetical protein
MERLHNRFGLSGGLCSDDSGKYSFASGGKILELFRNE